LFLFAKTRFPKSKLYHVAATFLKYSELKVVLEEKSAG